MAVFGYKKALVIGATSGIGRAIAEKLVQNGISTIIAGRRKENLDGFVQQHGSDKVQAKAVDILDFDEVCIPMQVEKRQRSSNGSDPPIRVRGHRRQPRSRFHLYQRRDPTPVQLCVG